MTIDKNHMLFSRSV